VGNGGHEFRLHAALFLAAEPATRAGNTGGNIRALTDYPIRIYFPGYNIGCVRQLTTLRPVYLD